MINEKIDFHVHIFPNEYLSILEKYVPISMTVREQIKNLTRLISPKTHEIQTLLRHLPYALRNATDSVASVLVLPQLLVESSYRDLKESLHENEITACVAIAHPPVISNEFILDLAQENSKIIPAVNLPPNTPTPGKTLKEWIKKGAKALKIHAAHDGENPDSIHYRTLLTVADQEGLPVILHTGCFHSSFFFKKPEYGNVRLYESWFKKYQNISFILAHMNFHEPQKALELAEKYSNVFVDTSWQPAEVIREAVLWLGAKKVLFASDWPLLGNTQKIGIQRIEACLNADWIKPKDAELIFGKNAQTILKLSQNATPS